MKISEKWHNANPMPKNPAIEKRIKWHLEHNKNCGCRPIPLELQDEIKKRSKARL